MEFSPVDTIAALVVRTLLVQAQPSPTGDVDASYPQPPQNKAGSTVLHLVNSRLCSYREVRFALQRVSRLLYFLASERTFDRHRYVLGHQTVGEE